MGGVDQRRGLVQLVRRGQRIPGTLFAVAIVIHCAELPGSVSGGELVEHLPQGPHPARRSPITGYICAGWSTVIVACARPRNASDASAASGTGLVKVGIQGLQEHKIEGQPHMDVGLSLRCTGGDLGLGIIGV